MPPQNPQFTDGKTFTRELQPHTTTQNMHCADS